MDENRLQVERVRDDMRTAGVTPSEEYLQDSPDTAGSCALDINSVPRVKEVWLPHRNPRNSSMVAQIASLLSPCCPIFDKGCDNRYVTREIDRDRETCRESSRFALPRTLCPFTHKMLKQNNCVKNETYLERSPASTAHGFEFFWFARQQVWFSSAGEIIFERMIQDRSTVAFVIVRTSRNCKFTFRLCSNVMCY